MDIAQLRTLVHVAELGSVTAAANRLRIAQPALSRQIRLLEEELGGKLFLRHGHGMALTELGMRVLAPAGDILSRIDDVRRLAQESSGSLRGRVRVGVAPTVAEVMSVPLARAIRDAHPHLSLCLTSGFSGHLVDWLKRRELDCCVAYEIATDALVRTVPILDESLLLVAGRDCGLEEGTAVAFAMLDGEPLILPSPAHGSRAILDAIAARASISLTSNLEADSLTAMIDLVRNGFGRTIMPYAPIHTLVQSGELVAVPLVDPVPACRVVMVYPADRPVLPAARFIGQAVATIASDLVGCGAWAGRLIADMNAPEYAGHARAHESAL